MALLSRSSYRTVRYYHETARLARAFNNPLWATNREMMSAIADKPEKEKRRRELLDAAFLEFSTKGYGGASMEAIARRARASKETLYAWFENKETLLNPSEATVTAYPAKDGTQAYGYLLKVTYADGHFYNFGGNNAPPPPSAK